MTTRPLDMVREVKIELIAHQVSEESLIKTVVERIVRMRSSWEREVKMELRGSGSREDLTGTQLSALIRILSGRWKH